LGADRFLELVRCRYYDDTRVFRVVAGRWAQFGIHGERYLDREFPRLDRILRAAVIRSAAR
jgi:cyclophilin family peptidyl-prolyl cis-trans isomerase